ncbi:hypothetical protein FIBSPDRAFT_1021419 [Athelia psychrophila]|uniref:Uncharacterized protein n=1 Tax=Athelia psychrophila TaxID=1759441 RepID=A0A166JQK8_9AGAM|nr:hypothetical protein FIBSPDRAFT_1021419 [Fibularhizoctonia sp. CBS 109695]
MMPISFKSFNLTKSTTDLDIPVPVLKPLLLLSPDEQRDIEEDRPNLWFNRFTAAASEQACIALMLRAFNSAEEWCALRGGSHRRVERDIKWDMHTGSFKFAHVRGHVRHTLPSEMFAEFEVIRRTRSRFALCAAQAAAAAKFVEAEFDLEKAIALDDISCDSGSALCDLLDVIFSISSCSSITAIKSPCIALPEDDDAGDLAVSPAIQSADQDTLLGLGLTFKKVADSKERNYADVINENSGLPIDPQPSPRTSGVQALGSIAVTTWTTPPRPLVPLRRLESKAAPRFSQTSPIKTDSSSPLSSLRAQAAMCCRNRRIKQVRRPLASTSNLNAILTEHRGAFLSH